MPEQPLAPGYERLTVVVDVATSLLRDMPLGSLEALVLQDAQQQIKYMIQEHKNG